MSYTPGETLSALQEYLRNQEIDNDPMYLVLRASRKLIDAGVDRIEFSHSHGGNYKIFLVIKEDVK